MFATYRGYSIYRTREREGFTYWKSPDVFTEYTSLADIQDAIRKHLHVQVVFIGGE